MAKMSIKERFKQIKKIAVASILYLSCCFGICLFLFICIFVGVITIGGCDNLVNGVCEISKSKDALLSNSLIPIFVISFPVAFLLYKKHRTIFYLISIPSFLFGIVVALS